MKKITLLFILILSVATSVKATGDSIGVKHFRRIIELIETDGGKALSRLVEYPLKRQKPLPDIKNANEFVEYFPVLFDSVFKARLRQFNEKAVFQRNGLYGLVGQNFSGEIWINEEGIIHGINYISAEEERRRQVMIGRIKLQMHPSVRAWNENLYTAKSDKLLIRIDEMDEGLRYVCWSNNKTMKDTPDIVLFNGIAEPQGTMGGCNYTFVNGDWSYIIKDVAMCEYPQNCGLFLELYSKEKLWSITRLKGIE
jgi:hypothetical protein